MDNLSLIKRYMNSETCSVVHLHFKNNFQKKIFFVCKGSFKLLHSQIETISDQNCNPQRVYLSRQKSRLSFFTHKSNFEWQH